MFRFFQQRSRRFGLATSVVLHAGLLLALFWGVPKLARRLNQPKQSDLPMEIMQVISTVTVPVAQTEPVSVPPPEVEPVPLSPEPVKQENETRPLSERKSKPRPVQRQTNRVVRTVNTPEPAEEVARPITPEEVRQTLAIGIPSTAPAVRTGGENDPAVAAYYDRVYQVMHAAWVQPPGGDAGLKTEVIITVGPDGKISGLSLRNASGNPAMDESVMRGVQAVKALPPPPAGFGAPREIVITFIRDS